MSPATTYYRSEKGYNSQSSGIPNMARGAQLSHTVSSLVALDLSVETPNTDICNHSPASFDGWRARRILIYIVPHLLRLELPTTTIVRIHRVYGASDTFGAFLGHLYRSSCWRCAICIRKAAASVENTTYMIRKTIFQMLHNWGALPYQKTRSSMTTTNLW